jgi:hypothetical protein
MLLHVVLLLCLLSSLFPRHPWSAAPAPRATLVFPPRPPHASRSAAATGHELRPPHVVVHFRCPT